MQFCLSFSRDRKILRSLAGTRFTKHNPRTMTQPSHAYLLLSCEKDVFVRRGVNNFSGHSDFYVLYPALHAPVSRTAPRTYKTQAPFIYIFTYFYIFPYDWHLDGLISKIYLPCF